MQLGQGFCASDEKYILALVGCKLASVHVGLWAKASVCLDSINPSFRYVNRLSWAELQRLSDEELMVCLKEGQNDGLAVLFDRYQKLVLSIALKIVRDPGEAEDVTQTVFLDIFFSRGGTIRPPQGQY
jgi:Sigma-70 region 2